MARDRGPVDLRQALPVPQRLSRAAAGLEGSRIMARGEAVFDAICVRALPRPGVATEETRNQVVQRAAGGAMGEPAELIGDRYWTED
jgi:hypothetical protein